MSLDIMWYHLAHNAWMHATMVIFGCFTQAHVNLQKDMIKTSKSCSGIIYLELKWILNLWWALEFHTINYADKKNRQKKTCILHIYIILCLTLLQFNFTILILHMIGYHIFSNISLQAELGSYLDFPNKEWRVNLRSYVFFFYPHMQKKEIKIPMYFVIAIPRRSPITLYSLQRGLPYSLMRLH